MQFSPYAVSLTDTCPDDSSVIVRKVAVTNASIQDDPEDAGTEQLVKTNHFIITLVNRSYRLRNLHSWVIFIIECLILMRYLFRIQAQITKQQIDPVKMVDFVNK